ALYYRVTIRFEAFLFIPLLSVIAFVTALGVGLWFSALNVRYRDVQYALPFVTQCWMFATPIAYPSSLLSESWRTVYSLNPMAGVVEGFRWALLHKGAAPGAMLAVSAAVALLSLVGGALYFRKTEKTFADII